ncbi:hypothetical protein PIROE2DRAFT_7724 [Piromyces sp. E2]|nr:hypothetical protein PIROE2DRAFT_7724 [Piromyces sp. E2]|eukprot:OUM65267.1 hypothetical protein PIROE2DRAFT_7724 [Piromyces sp. E2]
MKIKIKNILLSTVFVLTSVTQGSVIVSGDSHSFNKRQATEKFKYTTNCREEDSKNICNNVEEITKKITTDLSNTLEIYNTVTFNVYVDKLSKYEKEDTLLCQCVDINTVALKMTGDDTISYVYPLALAKQLTLDKNVPPRENDFTLVVNIDSIKKKMEGNTNALYMAMLHEMLHGFGIFQDLQLKKINKNDVNYVLLPKPIAVTTREEIESIQSISDFDVFSLKFGGFLPLSIYEKNIVDLASGNRNYLLTNLSSLYQNLNCFNPGISIDEMRNEDYKNCMAKLPQPTQQLMSSIPEQYYLKGHSMGFLTSEGKVIPLQTYDKEYHSDTSVIHIEFSKSAEFYQYMDSVVSDRSQFSPDQYIHEDNVGNFFDENLLMCPRNSNMYLSESLFLSTVGKNNKYGWISPDILSMLTTMGWTEKGKEKATTNYIIDSDINLPESINFPLTLKEYYPKQSTSHSTSNRVTLSSILFVSLIYFIISLFL